RLFAPLFYAGICESIIECRITIEIPSRFAMISTVGRLFLGRVTTPSLVPNFTRPLQEKPASPEIFQIHLSCEVSYDRCQKCRRPRCPSETIGQMDCRHHSLRLERGFDRISQPEPHQEWQKNLAWRAGDFGGDSLGEANSPGLNELFSVQR